MPAKKTKYQEGSWFSVPLRDYGYAVGRICKCSPPVVFGYFFGPRRDLIPRSGELSLVKPEQVILRVRFGDLGLVTGEWKLIGCTPCNHKDWPMPPFVRIDSISGLPSLVTYDPMNVSKELATEKTSLEETRGLPEDGLWGYGAVEIKLTKLLSQ